jgi:hypothetical protein
VLLIGVCMLNTESKCEGMVRYDKLYKVDTENYIVYTKTGNQ